MKMASQIPEQNPIIIGLSFGGMLATEIANHMPVQRLILISSAKTAAEVGYRNGIFKVFHGIAPSQTFRMHFPFLLSLFGARTADERALLKDIIQKSDGPFVKWSVGAILSWKNKTFPETTVHIHGTSDHIIYSSGVNPTHWIRDGSHIMICNRAKEISRIISDVLKAK